MSEHEPDFHHYLLAYPHAKPANYEETVLLGKGEIRLEADVAHRAHGDHARKPPDPIAGAIAQKQLFSSHYFETALDLSICVRGDDPKQRGFYLIKGLGSEQAGLSGAKGSIVRKAAVGRSVANLQKALTNIRETLEGNQ